MHDCRDVNSIGLNFVNNRERESGHESPPNVHSFDRTCEWRLLNSARVLFDRIEEIRTEAG